MPYTNQITERRYMPENNLPFAPRIDIGKGDEICMFAFADRQRAYLAGLALLDGTDEAGQFIAAIKHYSADFLPPTQWIDARYGTDAMRPIRLHHSVGIRACIDDFIGNVVIAGATVDEGMYAAAGRYIEYRQAQYERTGRLSAAVLKILGF